MFRDGGRRQGEHPRNDAGQAHGLTKQWWGWDNYSARLISVLANRPRIFHEYSNARLKFAEGSWSKFVDDGFGVVKPI
jgi:hypothetical protein